MPIPHRQPLRLFHRYHIGCSAWYHYNVLTGDIRLRVSDICRQVFREGGVDIICSVQSSDHGAHVHFDAGKAGCEQPREADERQVVAQGEKSCRR